MVIRTIKPEEKVLSSKIQNIAFLLSRDFSTLEENPEGFRQGYETTRAAFDDNGKMCSCMELIPYSVMFNGHIVKMGGIGGVASLPEERRKKYIRHIFEYCYDEMYENGCVFSYLYPFSHIYYRKFGYELNMTVAEVTIPFSSLSHFNQPGEIRMYEKGSHDEEIACIYNKYIQDKNLAVVREEKNWSRLLDKDPYKDNEYLYIWYDAEGIAKSYIQYKAVKKSEFSYNMRVFEFIWLDIEAFFGMLTYIKGFASQFDNLIWKCPNYVDILSYFPEPYDISQKINTSGMNRIVNCKKALELMTSPQGTGQVTIEVNDSFYAKNTGKYQISWKDSILEVEDGQGEPDLKCNINDLSQLVTGFSSIDQLTASRRIEVIKNGEGLRSLFVKRELFLNDYF